MTRPTVRRAGPGEATRATAAHRRAERAADGPFCLDLFRDAHGGVLAGLDPGLAERLLVHQFAGQASTYRARYPGARRDIIEVDGAPAGRMVVDHTMEAIVLVEIALLAVERGRGIGTALLRDLIAEARARGVPVRLSVRRDNAAARRLYTRLGFVETAASEMDVSMVWARPPAPASDPRRQVASSDRTSTEDLLPPAGEGDQTGRRSTRPLPR